MSKAGRPIENGYSKWIEGKETIIASACRNGATVDDLCRIIGCGKSVFHQMKKEFSEFSGLLKKNREVADLEVENALYKRAIGYEYTEESTSEVVVKDGNGATTYVRKTKKQMPPDTTAQIFWLKNRQPKKWRDKQIQEIEAGGFLSFLMQTNKITNDTGAGN